MGKRPRFLHLITLLIAAIAYLGLKVYLPASPEARASDPDTKSYVVRVVDGDTLKLADGQKVRLIGVDTPESHYTRKLLTDSKRSHKDIKTIQGLGRKATAFTKELCQGKNVRLEFDAERRDRYGRLLAYVYLEDGTFINAKILEEGYGQVMTVSPNVKYAEYFLRLQREARDRRRGLWDATDNL